MLAKAGVGAAEQEVATELQHLIVEELHHRIKNMLATVKAITSQSLRAADTLQLGREAIESRLAALGRVHDLLLQTNWAETTLSAVVKTAIEPYQTKAAEQFSVHTDTLKLAPNGILSIAMVLTSSAPTPSNMGPSPSPTDVLKSMHQSTGSNTTIGAFVIPRSSAGFSRARPR